MQKEAQMTGRN